MIWVLTAKYCTLTHLNNIPLFSPKKGSERAHSLLVVGQEVQPSPSNSKVCALPTEPHCPSYVSEV